MTFNEIQELIRMVGKHKISEFILKEGDFKLVIRNQVPAAEGALPVMAPIHMPVAAAPPPAPKVAVNEALRSEPVQLPSEKAGGADDGSSRHVAIKSPMVGTFYRSTSPDKPALVKVGDAIETGMPVCIIEAMKLFNEIESDIKGKIVKVLVEDASPVEYDQPLFLVDPA